MKKTIKDFDLNNKKVLIRVDFNVPIKDNEIVDDTRIKESLETINYALNNNAKVILLSHLGRIKEEKDKENNTLIKVAERLSILLNKKVTFIKENTGETVKNEINKMNSGEIILLENTRFNDLDNNKESSNDLELSKEWASYADIFINDAFGTIHRSHASNVGISEILKENTGIGFLIEKELKALAYLNNPNRPYTVIMGGSKVSDKIKVINNLIDKCDNLIIGGAMAFTFLKANGTNVGLSKVEDDYINYTKELLTKYNNKIVLPIDLIVSKEFNDINYINKDVNNLEDNDIGLDLGKETINKLKEILKNSKTVFWNGPLGYYEIDTYRESTKQLLTFLIDENITTILGGGDIVAASNELNLKDKVTHASTGGGATLEYLEGKELPGLKCISEK